MRLIRYATLVALLPSMVLAAAESNDEDKWDISAIPGEARDIPIDTNTGTWMSLDVSPDGRTVVFDLLGDIYKVSMNGGEATRIASGLAWTMQPRFSPDGSKIAYTSDAGGGDNIWIMDADGGNARQLTREDFRLLNNPSWSPDGRYIAARKHFTTTRSLGTGEIWIYHHNGGGGVAVVEKPDEKHQKELGEPAFSPDGRYIYFSVDSTPGGTFQYAQDSNKQIFEIRRHDLETGETESFVTGSGGAVRPEPSPDGKYLAFVRRIRGESALFIKDLESGAETPIYEGLEKDLQEVWGIHGLYPNMDWTPDSASIVFWDDGRIKRIDIASREVSGIDFHVADSRKVYTAPVPEIDVAPASFATTMPRNAEVSPDGRRVVFESTGALYVKMLPDGDIVKLTADRGGQFEMDPTWSRDGGRIAFVSWDDQELGHIHVVRARGGRSERLTSRPGHYFAPRFSPDGSALVYEARAGGKLTSPDWGVDTGVFILGDDGARRVTRKGSNPHFGSRGDRLYVTRPAAEGNNLELVSIDLNGESPRVRATGEFLKRYEVAPDDRHLAYRENYHVYAVPLPPGGKPLTLGTKVESVAMSRASKDGGNFPSWSAGGAQLNWTLGPTLYNAATDDLFALTGEDEPGFAPPQTGVSLSRQLDADVPDGTVAIVNATIITMTEPGGGVIDNGAIVIEGNRIREVGSLDAVAIPADAKRIDATGKTIIPGLIDAHAHGSQGSDLIPQQNWVNYATLALGVTTAFDPSHDATAFFAAAEMQRTGQILAPRLYSTGDIVYGAKSRWFAEINSLEDAREHVRRLKAQGAISVKNYNQPRREQRQQVTVASREENMLVVSEGGSLYHMDLSMVADGNSAIEHNIPQSPLYDDVLQFWGQSNVAYTPTLVVTYGGMTAQHYWYMRTNVWEHPILSQFVPPHILQPASVRRTKAPESDFHHIAAAAAAGQLAREGVSVSIGAHGEREGLASHWEMWGFAQGGMTPLEVLRTATTDAARKLGMQNDIGSLAPGKLADLVILEVNPLDDVFQTDQVGSVMLNGRLYDAKTLHETVTGDRRTEPFYWQR